MGARVDHYWSSLKSCPHMPLTDTAIRNAKPGAKPKKLADGFGMYLEISPTGGRYWRIKFRVAGKEKRLSLGVYPTVGLKAARSRRDDIRLVLANGEDPSDTRKAAKVARTMAEATTFETVAREWWAKRCPIWSADYGHIVKRRLEQYIFPTIGARALADLCSADLLGMLQPLEARGVGLTAHRVLGICGQVCRYAIATSRLAHDPTPALRGALTPTTPKHFAAVTKPTDLAALLRMLDGYQGTPVVASALRLAPLVFVRPGELRQAKWADIDLDTAEWRFLVTKTQTPHIVPLATQAVAVLRSLQPLTGAGVFVFPGARSNGRPMSDNAVLAAMRRMGIEKDVMSGHGFRAMARTINDEVLQVPPHLLEHQLSHTVKDPLGRAYNRTTHLPERQRMMQQWANYLDTLRREAQP